MAFLRTSLKIPISSPLNETDNREISVEQGREQYLKADLPKIMASMRSGAERIRNILQSLRNFS